jgi:hypothetical protein
LTLRLRASKLEAQVETAVQLIGIVPLGLAGALLVGYLLQRYVGQRPLSDGLALELARSVEEIGARVGDEGDQRRVKQLKWLDLDAFFVPAYWALFVALGVVLAFRQREWSWDAWPVWIGAAAVLAATVAAIADVSENGRLRTVLETPLAATTVELVRSIRSASLVKWGASAVTVALLTGLYTGDGRADLVDVLFLGYASVAAVGIIGLLWHPALRLFLIAAGALLLGTLAYFAVNASGFLQGFRLD